MAACVLAQQLGRSPSSHTQNACRHPAALPTFKYTTPCANQVGSTAGYYTEKSPKVLLHEWCVRQKRPRPKYRPQALMGEGGGQAPAPGQYRCKVRHQGGWQQRLPRGVCLHGMVGEGSSFVCAACPGCRPMPTSNCLCLVFVCIPSWCVLRWCCPMQSTLAASATASCGWTPSGRRAVRRRRNSAVQWWRCMRWQVRHGGLAHQSGA